MIQDGHKVPAGRKFGLRGLAHNVAPVVLSVAEGRGDIEAEPVVVVVER